VKTSSFITALCLLGIGILGLFLVYNRPAAPSVSETYNSAGLVKPVDAKPDSAVKNDINDVPNGDPGLKKQVKVDLSLQKAFLYENGRFIKEYVVSSGKASTPTPAGRFSIVYKSPKIYSQIAQCWLSFWAGFTKDGKYGFHETPVCNGQREGEDMIGHPASDGCLRLKVGDAEAFYKWIDAGTSIDIYGNII
jgi:lipoprotein-anchoring transpeptidase ErfK/SrfK